MVSYHENESNSQYVCTSNNISDQKPLDTATQGEPVEQNPNLANLSTMLQFIKKILTDNFKPAAPRRNWLDFTKLSVWLLVRNNWL